MNDNTIYISDLDRIGVQIGNLRRKQGLSQTDVARMSGVSVAFICKVEHGKCIANVRTLLGIYKALGYKEVRFITE